MCKLKKKNKVSYLDLLSNVLGVLHSLLQLIEKKSTSKVLSISYFIAEKIEAKGINEVTSKGKMISGECIYQHNKICRKGHDNVDSEQNKVDK